GRTICSTRNPDSAERQRQGFAKCAEAGWRLHPPATPVVALLGWIACTCLDLGFGSCFGPALGQ
ncbi:hypothetical protein H4217_009215, partial [Coemansia sp. RSA 1939]